MSFIGTKLAEILASITITPEPGQRVLVPGDEAVWDNCCVGQLSMRVTNITPRGTPQCITGWNVAIGVSLVRCVEVIDDQGKAPTTDEINADGQQMLDDMEQLRNELINLPNTVTQVLSVTLSSWTPVGVEGGCAGGEWAVLLLLPDC